jgi:PAS domain S-box-containing protein
MCALSPHSARLELDAFAHFEEVDYAVLVTDAQLSAPGPRIVYANPAFTGMTGWPRDEIVGCTPRVLQGPATDRALMGELKAALKRGERWRGETVNYRRDGAPYVVKWAIGPVRNADGDVVRYTAILEDVTDRRRTARREARYRAMTEQLMAAALEGVLIADGDGRIVRVNEGTEAIFGWQAEELEGRELDVLLPPRYRAAHTGYMAAFPNRPEQLADHLMARGREVTARHRDGQDFPVTVTVGRLTDEETDRFVAVIRDLSPQRKAEQQLAASQRRYGALFDRAFQAIGLLTVDGHLLDVNRTALDFIGADIEDVLGRHFLDTPWFEGAPPKSIQCVQDALVRAAAGESVRRQIDLISPTRETRVFDFSVRAIRDHDGSVEYLMPEGRDITAVVQAARETKRSERRLREAQRIANVGDWSWDIAAGVLQWSDQTYAIFGYTPDTIEPTIDLFMDAVHPDDRSRVQDAVAQAQTQGQGYSLDYRIQRRNGRVRSVRETAEVLFNPRGDAVALVGIVQDVTDWKAAESALVSAQKGAEVAHTAKTRFMAMVGHELRTPLNAINGFAEMLHSEMFGPLGHPKYREHVAHIRHSGRHLLELIERVLHAAHLDDGKRELTEDWLDLGRFLQETVRVVTAAHPEYASRIALDTVQPSRVYADACLLRQVLVNLIGNAVKFTPPGGRIRVNAEVWPDGVCALTVHDDGPGIPADEIERMTLPFVQRDDGLDRRHEGLGLGLFIAKTFLKLHGGHLNLHAPETGGTVAQAVLPAGRVDRLAEA